MNRKPLSASFRKEAVSGGAAVKFIKKDDRKRRWALLLAIGMVLSFVMPLFQVIAHADSEEDYYVPPVAESSDDLYIPPASKSSETFF